MDSKNAEAARTHAVEEGEPGNVMTGEAVQLVGQASLWGNAWKKLRRSVFFWFGGIITIVLVMMALMPQLFARGIDPRACNLSDSRRPPSAQHWFGTDLQGCDYYANVIYGARVSLGIGLLAVIGVLIIGVLIGALAGYFGGALDSVLARFTDIFFGIPLLLGALVLLTVTSERTIWTVSLALITFGWMTAMRLVRSSVIAIKESEYVQAAQVLGASTFRILVRHILPNALTPVLRHHRRRYVHCRGISTVVPRYRPANARHVMGPADQPGPELHLDVAAPGAVPGRVPVGDRAGLHSHG